MTRKTELCEKPSPRRPPAASLAPLAVTLFLAATGVLAASCDLFTYKRPFADAYYDNNFIAAIGFDQFVGDQNRDTIWVDPIADPLVPINPDADGLPLPVTGQWDLAYRYDALWDEFDYIELTDTAQTADYYAVPGTGLASDAPVYRVEVRNLIEGGNFEDASEDGAWSVTGTGTAVRHTATKPLFGDGCVKIDLEAGAIATYTTTALTGLPAFRPDVTYNLFFRYSVNAGTAKILIDNLDSFLTLNATGSGVQGIAKYTINNGAASAPGVKVMPLNPGDTITYFYVDNFRVARKGNMELRLLLKASETNPAMVPGTYSFSVWAYSDPPANDSGNPNYKMDRFDVKMAVSVGTTYLSTTTAVYAESGVWQKLTATLKPGALSFPYGTLSPVLALVIDLNESRPGSVLLAAPELRFYPDGL